MELLKEITNTDIGLKQKRVHYRVRKAARAVLVDGKKIALLYVSKHHYHKLPGGGVKQTESMAQSLAREIMEETGCTGTIKKEIGAVVEFRDNFKQIRFSYCFLTAISKKHPKQFFTKKEEADGFQLLWVPLDKAIDLLEHDEPTNYEGKFIIKRDIAFMKKAKEMLK